jgi:cbb3-type cytochrome oxidase subunit 3
MPFLVGVLVSTSLTSSESLSMEIRLQEGSKRDHTKAKGALFFVTCLLAWTSFALGQGNRLSFGSRSRIALDDWGCL